MFNKNNSQLDDAIARMHEHLAESTDFVDYNNVLSQLERLYAMKDSTKSSRVSPDTLALIAGNLAGIMLIVGHERAHVVTSKALSFVSKMK